MAVTARRAPRSRHPLNTVQHSGPSACPLPGAAPTQPGRWLCARPSPTPDPRGCSRRHCGRASGGGCEAPKSVSGTRLCCGGQTDRQTDRYCLGGWGRRGQGKAPGEGRGVLGPSPTAGGLARTPGRRQQVFGAAYIRPPRSPKPDTRSGASAPCRGSGLALQPAGACRRPLLLDHQLRVCLSRRWGPATPHAPTPAHHGGAGRVQPRETPRLSLDASKGRDRASPACTARAAERPSGTAGLWRV